jgi:serine protease AprX
MVKVKVFCPKQKQVEIGKLLSNPIHYDAFVIGETRPSNLQKIESKYPVEKLSELDSIQIGATKIDTLKPRYSKDGAVLPHPAYQHTKAIPKGSHYYFVQFQGPVKQVWLNAIRRAGGKLTEPFPNATYIVEMDKDTLKKISNLEFVKWIGHYDPQYRISVDTLSKAKTLPKIKDANLAISRLDKTSAPSTTTGGKLEKKKPDSFPNKYSLMFFSEENLSQAKGALTKLGVKVLTKSNENKRIVVDLHNAKSDPAVILSDLAQIHGVKQIEELKIPKLFNNVATSIMNASSNSNLGSNVRLSGKGEIIGIADTGIDSGDPTTVHPDFRGRIKAIKSYPINSIYDNDVNNRGANDGAMDKDSGHGTHVAGSVLGNGASSLAAGQDGIRGIGYDARLVFQAIEQEMDWTPLFKAQYLSQTGRVPPRYILAGLPDDLANLFQHAYSQGCRVHSNSWGSTGDFGKYDEQARQVDDFVWNHKNFIILFAAGNDGVDKNGNGKIDFGSVTPPGTAKNCITVGATENQRPEFASDTYGSWWPADFPVAPFKGDPMSNSSSDIVAFSSRGPTDDGRIKPDIVAPGTFILSTRSRYIPVNNYAWKKFPPNKDYFFMGGTSMATPLAAGFVAAVRQHLRTKANIRNPSAALIKASVIHGSRRINYRHPAEVRKGLYDMEQGWGLVDLEASTNPDQKKIKYIDNKRGLKTGDVEVFEAKINDSATSLKVTLTWTDFPGAGIINNLNLIVTSPDGLRYNGNIFEEPFDSKLDTTNNVETVYIQNPKQGTHRIEVIGSSVTQRTQDFALVYSGDLA